MRGIIAAMGAAALLAAGLLAEEAYPVRGKVVTLKDNSQVAVIHHEEVPGLMPAMTMPFTFPDEADFAKLSRGRRVAFEFVMGEGGSYGRAVEVLEEAAASPEAAAAGSRAAGGEEPRVREGDALPGFSLTGADGAPVALPAEDGRGTLLTFIFTRCPVPEFCPLLGSKYKELQDRLLEAGLEGKARLLSVTLDPEYDTPKVLREYGRSLGADPEIWSFATADKGRIEELARIFRVYRQERGGTLDHGLCTAYVGPEGRVEAIWRGNRWDPAEVFERLRALAAKEAAPGA